MLQSQAKESTHCFGALLLGSIIAVFFAANPASSATYADCKAHAINMSGDARQKFMNFMLGRHRREDTELRQRQTLWQLLHREG